MKGGTALLAALCAVVVLVGGAAANTTPQSLPLTQNWASTSLIVTNDTWSGVPGIIGYRGDAMTGSTGVDPQTVLADGSATPENVIANQTSPNTLTTGGIAEFELANPVVALQGSGTARAPHLVLSVDTTGATGITVSYTLRDVDGSADNAVQPVALQYRVGGTGSYTNLAAGFVADATTGPSLATLVTPVSVTLPPAADDEALVQIRIITADAVGSDEWVGIDDLSVATGADPAPAVASTAPVAGATGVAVDASVQIAFTEAVTAAGNWYQISCATSGAHSATVSGGPTAYTIDPAADFAAGETCTVTVFAGAVTDSADQPMASDHSFSFTTAAVPSAGVAISEVYGGGGNAGATLRNDFIELYNRTAEPISLAGWSVQYGSSGGTTWQVTPLAGSIPLGRNYLIQEAAGAGGTADLPGPDALGTIAMAAGAGKVALVSSTTALTGACPSGASIVDLVGYGAANCSETAPTPALSNTTAALRKDGGAQDTDSNANDFVVGTPDPHGTRPVVASTTPGAGAGGVAVGANLTITFSEPVGVGGDWFSIMCADSGAHTATVSGGPTTFTLDPAFDFETDESCMATVLAANVTPSLAADHAFTFQTAGPFICGDPATKIHEIQGSGATSPLAGSTVSVEGVVVGTYQGLGEFGGFYLQEEDADADGNPATSDGIFVFTSALPVSTGDVVRARGSVVEFATGTSSLTELTSVDSIAVCGSDGTATTTSITLPVGSLSDFERYEGMRVSFPQTLTATETFTLARFGEVRLAAGGRLFNPTAVAAPGPPAVAQANLNQRRSFVLDDGDNQQNIDPTRHPVGGLSALNTLRSGYTVGGLTGVFDDRFSAYRLQPLGAVPFIASNPRTAAPEAVGGNLKVAAFNVLNFFNGNGTHQEGVAGGFPTARGANTLVEFNRQLAKEVSALEAMNADVVGLMELENDAPPASAIEDLVDALNAAMGAGTYAFVDTGVIGTDEIKLGLIYKPDRVTPVGPYGILDSSVDPGFIDTRSRPALAQTFRARWSDERLTVVVNHLKSKGSACSGPPLDDPDTGDGQGNCNLTRRAAAVALVDWLASDPTGSGSQDFLVMGDLNSYTFEDPITVFADAGYHNLIREFNGLDAYSFVFNGEAGYLDHALASPSLAAKTTGSADWHINADEPIALDYNVEFKSPGQVASFYDAGPYRSSDHDPLVIGFGLDPTFARLCELTRAYVERAGVADALCEKLDAAEQAELAGDPKTKANALKSYVNQLEGQAGKAITAERAGFLIRLASEL